MEALNGKPEAPELPRAREARRARLVRSWTGTQVDQALARGQAAREEFESTLAELRASVTGLDALEVLARAAWSMTLRLAALDSDPMAKGVEVFHVECLQALSLSTVRRVASDEDDYAGATQSSCALIDRNGEAYRSLWLAKLTQDARHNRRQELIALLQSWTMAIRGPRHPHQTKAFVLALTDGVDEPFRQAFGCSAGDFAKLLFGIQARIEERFHAYLVWMRSWARKKSGIGLIDAFLATADAASAEHIRAQAMPHRQDRGKVFAYLWSLAERRLAPMMTFDRDELLDGIVNKAAAGLLLDSLALGFGDVSPADLQHLHLANPARLKPFVRLPDGRIFCCNPQSLGTNLAEIFQAVCESSPAVKRRLEKVRAGWLETKLGEVVAKGLPHADVRRSVKWTDAATGECGENDTVAVMDKIVLVFEAKSGKIGGPARRGALNSLKAALGTLVVDPSEQSARFRNFLARNRRPVTLTSAEGAFELDGSKIREVVRVNVLLDVVGPLSAHWPQLRDADLVPVAADIAPTMSIFEFETVMEVLKMEVERCHYLSRRGDLERDLVYVADELDLLGVYLDNQFNIDDADVDPNGLWFYGKSYPIASAYGRMQSGHELPDFPIRRAAMWTRLLETLETLRPSGWTRFSRRLLDFPYEAQKAFEKLVRQGRSKVARAPGHFFTSALTVGRETGSPARRTIAVAVGPEPNPTEFEANLQHATLTAVDQSGVEDPLLIYWFLPDRGQAYDFIGVMRHTGIGS